MSYFFGLMCLGFFVHFAINIKTMLVDLFSGNAKRLGMVTETIGLVTLVGAMSALLLYLGVHGVLGHITIDLLEKN